MPKYTLVLDLDETLIYYVHAKQKQPTGEEPPEEDYYMVRPYALKFLKELAKYFEIVIFTAATKQYADPIIDDIDPDKVISHRLYRRDTYVEGNVHIKDLEIIGRHLSKTLIVDNICDNFKYQKEHGIHIRDWYGNYSDDRLKRLSEVLIGIVNKEPEDITQELKLHRDYIQQYIE